MDTRPVFWTDSATEAAHELLHASAWGFVAAALIVTVGVTLHALIFRGVEEDR